MISMLEYYAGALTKNRSSLISFAIQPLSFIFLLTVISGGRLLPNALIGAMVSFIAGVGIADLAIELAGLKTRSKFYDILMTLPVHPLKLGLGISIGMSLPALPYLVLLVLSLAYLEGLSFPKLLSLLAALALLWLWSVFVGLYLGVKLKEPIVIMRASNIALTLLTVFLPVYYPVEVLPSVLQKPLLLLPTSAAAYLIRSLYESLPYWKLSLAALLMWAALSGMLAFWEGIFREE
ncbi:multidrug transporter [Thermococcus sp. LS1]|uniref:multidrug transporter n=1 Tax=Thermococcus sp. LS1 TaxID=1638259 RepID=UPI0014389F6B|nr:multidrug transporter [Thermococcus sp. LS1]NJD98695.1 multidrug transporter [Thermococcus sp. LS1]